MHGMKYEFLWVNRYDDGRTSQCLLAGEVVNGELATFSKSKSQGQGLSFLRSGLLLAI